jgi:hypothetical protein
VRVGCADDRSFVSDQTQRGALAFLVSPSRKDFLLALAEAKATTSDLCTLTSWLPPSSLRSCNDDSTLSRYSENKRNSRQCPQGWEMKGVDMVGVCETCDRAGEVFQLPGRKDSNCGACTADIAMLISLHVLMKQANNEGESTAVLETEAKPILQRLLARRKPGRYGPSDSRFCH